MSFRQSSTRIHKIARQGGGFFSFILLKMGVTSYYEVAEFGDRGEIVFQATASTNGIATEADYDLLCGVLAGRQYMNEFPEAARMENTEGRVELMLKTHRSRN